MIILPKTRKFVVIIILLSFIALYGGENASVSFGQSANTHILTHSYTLVNGTFIIPAHDQVYTALYTRRYTVNSELKGSYEEYKGQNIRVILFDGADCLASDSLGRVNITSCTTSIFDETKPAGSIDLFLEQGKTYYLAFENGNNANATVSADFVDYYGLPIKPNGVS